MEDGVLDKMMKINGGKKVIPTIVIDEKILTAYDKEKLKEVLSVK